MKKMNKFIMAVILFLSGFTAYAYDFEVGGIYYNITSETDLECEVTYKGYYNQSSYSGNMAIPSTVEYNGKKYSVTAIGSSAFESCSSLEIHNHTELGNNDWKLCICKVWSKISNHRHISTINRFGSIWLFPK